MESVIFCLRSFMAGRHTQIRAENFKQWMWEAYPEDYYKNPPADQSMDVSGEHRPTHLAQGGYPAGELWWTVLVLIPKGTIDTRGIGLLETLWEVVEALIETSLHASL